ncbi:hypothetical protein [Streptomyces sp. NBC_00572]|uniref:hypothetical protein n=1 Tax=Streptomyces sp. NBC_00572 TaxID=2903664 RepID=UPI002252FD0F|nr:hypothetical protein [Streptomyces sp. NBC_00572]MCX4986617.1 hypothetical protein [Streptomyces sp. NBC_00572]
MEGVHEHRPTLVRTGRRHRPPLLAAGVLGHLVLQVPESRSVTYWPWQKAARCYGRRYGRVAVR